MKKIFVFLSALTMIVSCNDTDTKNFKQATCNVEHESFAYRSTIIDNTQTSMTIKGNNITIRSPSSKHISNNLGTQNKLSYKGSKDIGTFSYTGPKASAPIEMGAIGYMCWSGLRTNFKNKISFDENIRRK